MLPTPTRRDTLRLAGGALAVTLAGCLGDEAEDSETPASTDTDGTGQLGDPATSVDVSVVSIPSVAFEPGIVHVEPGGTVRWVVDGHRHDVTAYHPDTYGPQRIPDGVEPWKSDLLREGREFERTFQDEGVYDYVDTRALCATHEALGGVGRVVVGWPDLDGQPALEHDIAELPGRAETVMRTYDEETRSVLEER